MNSVFFPEHYAAPGAASAIAHIIGNYPIEILRFAARHNFYFPSPRVYLVGRRDFMCFSFAEVSLRHWDVLRAFVFLIAVDESRLARLHQSADTAYFCLIVRDLIGQADQQALARFRCLRSFEQHACEKSADQAVVIRAFGIVEAG